MYLWSNALQLCFVWAEFAIKLNICLFRKINICRRLGGSTFEPE